MPDPNLVRSDMPQPKIIFLEGLDAQALTDALTAYGPSRMGNHTLHAALLHRLRNEREYRYEPIGYFSRGLSHDVHHIHRELRALRERFNQPHMHQAVEDARPLLDELWKIVDALDESNGTDPESEGCSRAEEELDANRRGL